MKGTGIDEFAGKAGVNCVIIPLSLDSPGIFNATVDRLIALLGDSLELLGFGEALHFGEDILILRNFLLQHPVESHGFSTVAIENNFPRGRKANEYVAGRGPASSQAVQEAGFSHGFGQLEPNRDLVGRVRRYSVNPSHRLKLPFYGFNSPTR